MIKLLQNKWVWIAAVGGAGVLWFFSGDNSTSNLSFQTQAVSRGNLESIVNTAGTINPTITVQVGSEVSGLIKELLVDFNSPVTEGQLLARIDDRDILVTLRQREADLGTAKANLVQSQAALINAETRLQFSRNELERIKTLIDRRLVSESELETATNNVRSAEASLEQAKSNIVSAQANILQREAQLEQTQIDLERTYIRSPVDGVVLNRLVDLGQAVSANQNIPTLFAVAQDLSSMQIEASIDEADIGKISEGMPVRFRVDAYPQRTFTGAISQVRKAATTSSGVVSYKVIIAATNPGEILLPGMTANLDIILGSKTDVLRVPNAALRFRPPESAISAEQSTATAGNGGANMSDRVGQLVTSLQLTDQQRKEVERIFAEQAQAMQAMAAANGGGVAFGGPGGGGGGGFGGGAGGNSAMANIRSRMDNELKLVLSEEQYNLYRSQQPQGGGRGGAGATGGSDVQQWGRGEVWVMDGRGLLRSISVRTGLADAEYTEIQTDQLNEGDQIVVRAAMTSQ